MSLVDSGVIVLFGVLACIAVGLLVVERQRRLRPPYPTPELWGVHPDDAKWEAEADEIRHKALSDVRESAKAWAATVTALLGVGATVGFVKGEDTFAKLTPAEGNFAFWLIVAAALLAGVAILLAALAAQGTPLRFRHLDGWTLSEVSRESTAKASVLLLWSRVTAVTAALALFVGFGISWQAGIASDDPDEGVSAIAATADGVVRCGELGAAAEGALTLVVDGAAMSIREGSTVDTVEACPKSK